MAAFMAQAADMQIFRLPSRTLVRRQASACGLLRAVVAVLAITMVGNSIAYGQTATGPNATKQKLMAVGISKRVKIKEVDGTKLSGTLTAVNEDSFLILPKDGGPAVTIPYSQTEEVKRSGLSKGAKIAIYIAVGLGVYIAISAIIFEARGGIFGK